MEKSKTIEILKALASGADGRSESARLADIIEDVENALKGGVKRRAVLDALHNHYNFKMTMSGFEKALRKLRNKENTQSQGKIIDQKSNYPVSMASTNTTNQLAQYIHHETKNTELVTSHSSSKSMDLDLEEEEDEGNWEPKSGELEFMKNLRKDPNITELYEMQERYRAEQKEKKKREREQAKLKNQSTY